MYTVQNTPSFDLSKPSRGNTKRWVSLAASGLIVCILLSFITSFWGNLLHFSPASAKGSKAPTSSASQINIPYFNGAVPFNQTAIFWFGDVSSTNNYVDVRIGYNSSGLYINLQIVDRYLWYDTNTSAPNLNNYDNASVYLSTATTSATLVPQQTFMFQTGVNGYKKRSNYQQAYSGNGTTWSAAKIPFTAVYGWKGHGLNGADDKGWSMAYTIPFSSLGMSAPSQGAAWKLAVQVQNKDSAAQTPPLAATWWPTAATATNPSSWGNIVYGLPTYTPPSSVGKALPPYTIRNGLNSQVVTDGMVGGGLGCGSNVSDVWTQLGGTSYTGATQITVENEENISDWNCFSKIYMTFPLSSLPAGNIIKATVTLYEYSNAGTQGQPNPSYIQVATVGQNWNPATLSWNNAPQVQENFGSILVNTKTTTGVLPPPGLPQTWDVSAALAQAYAAGDQSLQLVFYSTDDQQHGGKYFWSSTVGSWNAGGRPELQVSLG